MPDEPKKPEPKVEPKKPEPQPKTAKLKLSDEQREAILLKHYPTRPEVTCEIEEGATVVVFYDNQKREIGVERYSPGN